MNVTVEQQKKIDDIGRRYRLKLMLLHGSYARGLQRPGSDLDIAVLGSAPLTSTDLLTMHGDMAGVFGDSPERELDLKTLQHADPLFLYEVLKHSQLLYGTTGDYSDLRAHAFQRFFDSGDLFRLEKLLVEKFQAYLNERYVTPRLEQHA